jgi:hypothetical protein
MFAKYETSDRNRRSFFKAQYQEKLYQWYEKHLGIRRKPGGEGAAFHWREDYDYGRFAWIMDPEGNRIELWEPPKTQLGRGSTPCVTEGFVCSACLVSVSAS